MRRYINSILLLSITGVFLSGVLLFQHYFPDLELGPISCGKGIVNDCIAVGQSDFSSIFGIPLAAIGIAYYLIIAFLMLIADYAKDKYYKTFMIFTALFVLSSLIADIVLGSILLYLGEICMLCISTYAVNILTFLIVYIYIKNNTDIPEIKKILINFVRPKNSDEKAALSLFILFFFFLTFSVFAANNILKVRAEGKTIPQARLADLVKDFYRQKPEAVAFPESRLIVGNKNAPVKIYAFTDFLCSACYKLYESEKFILSKYKNKVQIIYYHYPLDSECNKYMDDQVYKNSCIASRAMEAAADSGVFSEYFYTHFSNYRSYKSKFKEETAFQNIEKTVKSFGLPRQSRLKFLKRFKENNKEHSKSIERDIELAEKYKIEATPTFYIAGRKVVGVPPKEMLDLVIEKELSKK